MEIETKILKEVPIYRISITVTRMEAYALYLACEAYENLEPLKKALKNLNVVHA